MIQVEFDPKPQVLRQFAYVAVVGLPLIALVVLKLLGLWSWTESWTHPAMLAAGGIGIGQLLLFTAGVRAPTRWVFVVLMLVALPIGFVISHVLMAVIYYLVITPIGLFFRLVGRDVIGRKLDPRKVSYWHDRGAPRPASSYFKLY